MIQKIKEHQNLVMIILVVVVAFLFISDKLGGKGGNKNVYEDHKNGYVVCDYVDGVEFDIPERFLNISRAVNYLTESDDTYLSDVWLYKTENSLYEMFSHDEIFIIVKKGTNFSGYKSLYEAFNSSPLDVGWLKLDDKKLDKEEMRNGIYKRIANAGADISLNPQFYGFYSGRFATISNGAEEWSMFVGYYGDSYAEHTSSEKDIISHMIASFRCTKAPEKANEETDLSEDVNPSEEALQGDEVPQHDEPEDVHNIDDEDDAKTEPISEEIPDTPADVTPPSITENEQPVMVDTKESSIESPLTEGESGEIFLYKGEAQVPTYITLNKVYKDADVMLKEKLNDHYISPERGTHWEMAEFSLGVGSSPVKANIVGMDGNTLKYNGVKFDIMTFDYYAEQKLIDKNFAKCYIYYAVPNGCESYLLKFGDDATKVVYYLN